MVLLHWKDPYSCCPTPPGESLGLARQSPLCSGKASGNNQSSSDSRCFLAAAAVVVRHLKGRVRFLGRFYKISRSLKPLALAPPLAGALCAQSSGPFKMIHHRLVQKSRRLKCTCSEIHPFSSKVFSNTVHATLGPSPPSRGPLCVSGLLSSIADLVLESLTHRTQSETPDAIVYMFICIDVNIYTHL